MIKAVPHNVAKASNNSSSSWACLAVSSSSHLSRPLQLSVNSWHQSIVSTNTDTVISHAQRTIGVSDRQRLETEAVAARHYAAAAGTTSPRAV